MMTPEGSTYLTLILVLLLGSALLDTTADWLNLRNLKTTLPDEFKGLYDEEKYALSQRYLRENTRFAFLQRGVTVALTIGFIWIGGFNWVDLIARSPGWGTIGTGLAFVAILSVLRMIVSLPFSLYDTFVIEEKYGFNRTTPKTFVTDMMKGLLLSVVIGAPAFSVVVYFFETFGGRAWLYSWMIFTAFFLTLSFLAPAFLMPLFNKFEPLPEGPLKDAIEVYARKEDFKLQGIYTMDGSKRSTKANAFFAGFGKFRRLVLFDTLIAKHSIEELVAILAHEIGHFKCRHIPKFTVLSIVSSGLMFFVMGFFINNEGLFSAFRMEALSVYASLVFVGFLYSPITRVFSLFTQRLSRKFEFEADAYSVRTYGHPEMLASGLKKLSVDNLSNLHPHWLKVVLDYTHPPVLERVKAIRKLV